ncbi:MAG: hypothetical protein QOE54_6933 [Streptosporangiaceae bacterium]|jgi:hypothetical protein|nr:hypothetical protein [Streptosporangiaceae bacterium]MDX6434567.1 hypothetical protein [Streptosporangiaceae bacterium]
MTEQPGHVLDEAVKLFEVLRRRIRDGSPARPRPEPGDVWGQATYEAPIPHIATGAPECRYCPICRGIAAARTARPGLTEQVMDAGQSLYTALQEALSALDRPHPDTSAQRERATPTPPRPREERPGAGGNPTDSG